MEATGFIVVVVIAIMLVAVIKAQLDRMRRDRLMAKYGDVKIVDGIMSRSYWQGMTAEMLEDSLGSPADIGTKVMRAKTINTYKYHQTGKNRFRTRIILENGLVIGWDEK